MKTFFVVLPLALILSGCTTWNSRTGKFYTMGDSKKFSADYFKNGNMKHVGWEENVHTPVTKAHWHGVTTLGSEAVMAGIGGAAGGAASIIPTIVNRPTSRAVAK